VRRAVVGVLVVAIGNDDEIRAEGDQHLFELAAQVGAAVLRVANNQLRRGRTVAVRVGRLEHPGIVARRQLTQAVIGKSQEANTRPRDAELLHRVQRFAFPDRRVPAIAVRRQRRRAANGGQPLRERVAARDFDNLDAPPLADNALNQPARAENAIVGMR